MIESFKLPVITKETVSGSVASFNSEYAELPLDELIVAINAIQSGSGTPSPSNVRPISGWTQANIVRCGVNLWDEEWEVGSYNESTGGKTTSVTTTIRNKNPIIVKSGLSYYLSIPSVIRILQYRRDGSYINAISSPDSHIYSPSDEVGYINFRTITAYGTVYNNDISINYPSTDTDYHAYNGNTYTIPFGQTVYAGTLDVLTGELTVTHMFVNCTGANEFNRNNGFVAYRKTGLPQARGRLYAISNIISEFGSFSSSNMTKNIIQTPDSDTMYIALDEDVSIGSLDVLYELATPITIQLTPAQITTLIGENVIFADTGNTSVKYLKI